MGIAAAKNGAEWVIEESVRSVVCPGCAFTFDAIHLRIEEDEPCPACAEVKLVEVLEKAQKETRHWKANHDKQVASKRVTAQKRDEFKAERDEAQGKIKAIRELHAFDCTIDQACLVSLDDVDAILRGTKEEATR